MADPSFAIAGFVIFVLLILGVWKAFELLPKIFRKILSLFSRTGIEIKRPAFLQRRKKKLPTKTAEKSEKEKKKWVKKR